MGRQRLNSRSISFIKLSRTMCQKKTRPAGGRNPPTLNKRSHLIHQTISYRVPKRNNHTEGTVIRVKKNIRALLRSKNLKSFFSIRFSNHTHSCICCQYHKDHLQSKSKNKVNFRLQVILNQWDISNLQMVPKMLIIQFHHSFEPKGRISQQLLSIF